MMLLISLVLALVPLLGIVWIILSGSVTTVDGLFMSLILLAMSGILLLNLLLELRKRRENAGQPSLARAKATAAGHLRQQGRVENVQFYEAGVGQPNKSLVVLSSNSAGSSQMLVFEGDLRNALPVGRKVDITFRKESGYNVLANVDYP